MSREVKIRILKNGPYAVEGGPRVAVKEIVPADDGGSEKWTEGKVFDAPEKFAICRCGKSANKPFCDGSHIAAGFEGEETADRAPYAERAKSYKGEDVELLDDESLCVGARFCDRFGGVWKLAMTSSEKHPERGDMAVYEATNCPAGRLTIRRNGELVEPESEAEIGLVHDLYYAKKGPYALKGDITLVSADGTEYEKRARMTLCRCGASKNMPFCDGTHMHEPAMDGIDDEG